MKKVFAVILAGLFSVSVMFAQNQQAKPAEKKPATETNKKVEKENKNAVKPAPSSTVPASKTTTKPAKTPKKSEPKPTTGKKETK